MQQRPTDLVRRYHDDDDAGDDGDDDSDNDGDDGDDDGNDDDRGNDGHTPFNSFRVK